MQVSAEAYPILYSSHFRFETSGVLLNFLISVSEKVRQYLTIVEIVAYQKNAAASSLQMLADSKQLWRVHIGTGVGTLSTPTKGSPEAALDVLRFGKTTRCFSIKEGDDVRAWTDEERQEFQDLLLGKLM